LVLIDELRDAWRTESRDDRVAFLCILVIAIDIRLLYLRQPMRYDEAVTYLYFVRQPWADALSLYTYPNNHLFHTVLAKASVTLFGASPWALRLPALLAGTLIVPATYAVARELYDSRSALYASAITAASGALVLYSTNARGYSIVGLAFLVLVLQALRLSRGATPSEWLVFAVIAALGLWAIPIMLYPLGAVALWFALLALVEGRQKELRRFVIALGVTAGLTLMVYLPVISREGLAKITQNKFVQPSGWLEFFEQISVTGAEALTSWSLGVPPLISMTLAGCAIYALWHHARLSKVKVGLALASFVWSAWVLALNHRAPFARVWLWFLPFVAILAAVGGVELLLRWRRSRRVVEERSPTLSVALSLGLALSVVFSYAVLLTRDTGTYREASQAAAVFARVLRDGDLVLVGLPTNAPLAYYLDRLGIPLTVLTQDEKTARRVFAVFDRAEGQDLDRIIGNSGVKDSTLFMRPAMVAELQASVIVVFQRRTPSNVPAK
jgi:4-amino-4-deoxy-L-arabinose transferase-like glycosyltransferase